MSSVFGSPKLRGQGINRSLDVFRLGNLTFASREAFIESGARCRSVARTPAQLQELDDQLMEMRHLSASTSNSDRTVKVYFHAITSSSGQGHLSESAIREQISVLNRAYAHMHFQFELTHSQHAENDAWFIASQSSSMEADLKSNLRQGSYADLNIYTTAQVDGTLGWATLPASIGTGDFRYDGVIVDYRTLPGGDFAPYNEGMTIVHETGHWLGLEHTFEGGCAADGANGGDMVADTPAEAAANYGCPADGTDSCPGGSGALAGEDPIHNYMDYTDDGCMNAFTQGQAERAYAQWKLYRCTTCRE
jgi:hypothetical protein